MLVRGVRRLLCCHDILLSSLSHTLNVSIVIGAVSPERPLIYLRIQIIWPRAAFLTLSSKDIHFLYSEPWTQSKILPNTAAS